jgi:hypothetical protein
MTLSELYEQQHREREQVNIMRDKIWADLQRQQEQIAQSFGGTHRLPDDMRKRFDAQITTYHDEWASETGQRYKEMQQLHEQQRESLTGIKPAKLKQPQTEQKPKADELGKKQDQLQKIIAQQQAIRKQQQERKRGR